VLDGTSWTVEIINRNEPYQFTGNIVYPDMWGVFCKVVVKLIGKNFN